MSELIKTEAVRQKAGRVDQTLDDKAFEQQLRDRLGKIVKTEKFEKILGLIEGELANRNRVTKFSYKFRCFAEDGAFAIHRAVTEILGYSSQRATGPSADPPEQINVRLGSGQNIKVPWGNIQLPGLGDDAEITLGYDKKNRILHVQGQAKQRYISALDEIMELANRILDTDSIYRGRAISLGSEFTPKFKNLDKYGDAKIFLNEATKRALIPIETRIMYPDKCVERGIELRYGALMVGPYGTGKTLKAWHLAYQAIQNGWTFIYLEDPSKVAETLQVASDLSDNGKGVVVFVEDINLVFSGERDAEMNVVLNTLDGGDTKFNNVIVVFSTNHPEQINETAMRGKRISGLIPMGPLSRPTAVEFIQDRFPHLSEKSLDKVLDRVEELEIVPAFMAVILEEVATIQITKEIASDGDVLVTADDILSSIKAFERQMDMARMKEVTDPNAEYVFQYQKTVLEPVIKKVTGDIVREVVEEELSERFD